MSSYESQKKLAKDLLYQQQMQFDRQRIAQNNISSGTQADNADFAALLMVGAALLGSFFGMGE